MNGAFLTAKPLTWAFKSVQSRGPVLTFKVALSVIIDLGFDLRYGTDTMGWVQVKTLDFESEHKGNAARYSATKSRPLQMLMRKLGLPRDGVFVDLGSGKGRVLLIAAQFDFKRIVGVEFSPELCDIARENVKTFTEKAQTIARIDVVEADVASYCIESEQNVFFMFNPFDKVVTDRLLANLHASVTQFPRKIWLIYNTPVHDEAVSKAELFCACQEFEITGNEFKVYSN
jgi:SAM-dependent methyltransferase